MEPAAFSRWLHTKNSIIYFLMILNDFIASAFLPSISKMETRNG
jgi:hypothetical protein